MKLGEPVASEFRKLFEEQKFGLPVRDALMNLTNVSRSWTSSSSSPRSCCSAKPAVILAEILDNLSYVIRERFKIMRQVRVHTAQGRMTMMLLMGLPPHHRDHHADHEPQFYPAPV